MQYKPCYKVEARFISLYNDMKNWVIIFCWILASCGQEETTRQNSVLAIQEIGQLSTTEFTVSKIIKASDEKTWFKMGNRKILMSSEATIKAGVDFSLVKDSDFTINDKSISLRLPLPAVFSVNLPPEKIKLVYQETGVFRDPFTATERNALAVQAEKQIRNSLDSLGIIKQAKSDALLFVSKLLQQLGYENVKVSFKDPAELLNKKYD